MADVTKPSSDGSSHSKVSAGVTSIQVFVGIALKVNDCLRDDFLFGIAVPFWGDTRYAICHYSNFFHESYLYKCCACMNGHLL